MAFKIPPTPVGVPPGHAFWQNWYEVLRTFINEGQTTVQWANINFTASNITDIMTREHNALQAFQGGVAGEYYHLTAAEQAWVVAGKASHGGGWQNGKIRPILDEGVTLSTNFASMNFVGAGVTASAVGDDITVTIPGGGGVGTNTTIIQQFYSDDVVDGEMGPPGPTGPQGPAGATGSAGANGAMGFGIDGADGEDGMPIPGARGATGATGAAGASGVIMFIAEDPIEPELPIPGPAGPQGIAGGGGGGGLTQAQILTLVSYRI